MKRIVVPTEFLLLGTKLPTWHVAQPQAARTCGSPFFDHAPAQRAHHGVAGFPSGESYKLGSSYPYVRMQRGFLRQTIDLGGDVEKVDADISQFAGTRTRRTAWC